MKKYFLLGFFIMYYITLQAQSKLESSKREFEKDNNRSSGNTSTQQNTNNYRSNNHQSDSTYNRSPNILALFNLIYYTFKGSYALIVSTPGEPAPFLRAENGGKGFNQYPYAEKSHGLYLTAGEGDKNDLLRVKSAYIHHNTSLNGFNAELNYFPIGSVSFDYQLHQYWELTPEGENVSLGINRLMLNFHRIRTAFMNIHYGLGIMFYKSDTPFSFEIGAEIFPFKPLSLEFDQVWSFNKGNILSTTDLELKYHLKNFAPYLAYQRLNTNYFPIKSFMLGVQLIF